MHSIFEIGQAIFLKLYEVCKCLRCNIRIYELHSCLYANWVWATCVFYTVTSREGSWKESLLAWFTSFRFSYWSYKYFIFLVFMNKFFALNTEMTQYHALTQQTHWIHRQFCVDMVVPTNWTCDWDWTASK